MLRYSSTDGNVALLYNFKSLSKTRLLRWWNQIKKERVMINSIKIKHEPKLVKSASMNSSDPIFRKNNEENRQIKTYEQPFSNTIHIHLCYINSRARVFFSFMITYLPGMFEIKSLYPYVDKNLRNAVLRQ